MKKTVSVLCLLVVLGLLAVPAQAAFNANVTISPSASTLHRGDSFTITAVLNNTDAIKLGTVVLQYDTNVFEMTGGSCHVEGANPAMVVVASKAGTFMVSEETAVSGTVFTFNMKVKDNAAFGSYTIASISSVGISVGEYISSGSAGVTVACNHSYGNYTSIGDTQHSRVCTICKTEEKADHVWNSGVETKAATCKEEGVKTYTCTVCGGTKTEAVSKTTTHSYGKWIRADATNHKRVCSVCGKEETAAHSWGAGVVTKAATCKEDGEKTFTCADCGATKKEVIDKSSSHSYGKWTRVDAADHKRVCSVCEKAETAAHSWNAGTVTKAASCKEEGVRTITCTDCGAARTEAIPKSTEHKFGSWIKMEGDSHMRTCTVCLTAGESAAHSWNSGAVTKVATCKEEGVRTITCTDCGAAKTESIPKTTDHRFGKWIEADANSHKKTCSVCALEETAAHGFSTKWNSDKDQHYYGCSDCGAKKDAASHTPGAEATESTAQRCTVCNYIIKAALGHTHEWAAKLTSDATGHWYACSGCNEKKDLEAHNFDNDCDGLCEVCQFTRTTEHKFGTEWESDANSHYHACAVCGEMIDEAGHTPGMEATEKEAQTCTVCGFELVPALGHTHTFGEVWEKDGSAHWRVCECGEKTDEADHIRNGDGVCTVCLAESEAEEAHDADFPWWIIVLLIICGGAALVVILIKKKK